VRRFEPVDEHFEPPFLPPDRISSFQPLDLPCPFLFFPVSSSF
jgi:hypothetical protein